MGRYASSSPFRPRKVHYNARHVFVIRRVFCAPHHGPSPRIGCTSHARSQRHASVPTFVPFTHPSANHSGGGTVRTKTPCIGGSADIRRSQTWIGPSGGTDTAYASIGTLVCPRTRIIVICITVGRARTATSRSAESSYTPNGRCIRWTVPRNAHPLRPAFAPSRTAHIV